MVKKRVVTDDFHLFPLFEGLNQKEREDVARYCSPRKAKKNTYLYRQNDPMDRLYFLCQGKARVYKVDNNGRDFILSIYTAGQTFPYDHFLRDDPHHSTHALAEEDAELFTIAIADLEHLLIKYPQMSISLLKLIGKELHALQFRLENKMLNTIEEQVVKLLLHLSKDHGVVLSTNQILFLTPFQVKDLANMIGLTRETVSRVIAKLISANLIERDAQGRFVLNPSIQQTSDTIQH